MTDDLSDRPHHLAREAELHEVRMRMHEENKDWVFPVISPKWDLRDAQLLGENHLRMKREGRQQDEQAVYAAEVERQRELVDEWASLSR